MRVGQAAVVVVLCLLVGAGSGGAMGAPAPESALTTSIQSAVEETPPGLANQSNVSLGSQLSAVLQSSAAQTAGSVESGMWEATVDSAPNESRQALINRRLDRVSARIDALTRRKRAVTAAMRNGTISTVAYRAQLSRILGRLAAVKEDLRALDRPDRPAPNRTTVKEVATRADALAGPEISNLARSLGGAGRAIGPPDWVERGRDASRPANDGSPAGPAGDNRRTPGSATESADNDRDPPADRPANRTDTGPPSNASNAGGPSDDGARNGTDAGNGPPKQADGTEDDRSGGGQDGAGNRDAGGSDEKRPSGDPDDDRSRGQDANGNAEKNGRSNGNGQDAGNGDDSPGDSRADDDGDTGQGNGGGNGNSASPDSEDGNPANGSDRGGPGRSQS